MKVLVAAASKHGSTEEIAQRIGQVMREADLEVTVSAPREVPDLDEFDAVLLGSAVYAGHWMSEAKELAERLASMSRRPPTWLFSSGPVGDPPKPEEDPVDVAGLTEMLAPRGHRVFTGKIDRSKLGFAERAIVTALRAPEGDFRSWEDVTAWAQQIAESLQAEVGTSGIDRR